MSRGPAHGAVPGRRRRLLYLVATAGAVMMAGRVARFAGAPAPVLAAIAAVGFGAVATFLLGLTGRIGAGTRYGVGGAVAAASFAAWHLLLR